MKANEKQPVELWTIGAPSPSVKTYIDGIRSEFSLNYSFKSSFPYSGLASKKFRFVRDAKEQFFYFPFPFKNAGCWKLRQDGFQNNLTADVLAAVDLLGGNSKSNSFAYMAPSGLEGDNIVIPLLDGGVTVYLRIVEHSVTNNVRGYQGTFIWGPHAYRVLTMFLGFDWSPRRLTGEERIPQPRQIWDVVDSLLASDHARACFSAAWANRTRP
jgi:hypothetical protein